MFGWLLLIGRSSRGGFSACSRWRLSYGGQEEEEGNSDISTAQWGHQIIYCNPYLLPAGGTVAEHCQLPDWLLALGEGDGHHHQEVEAKLKTEG